ncbi:MAG: RNA polymerase sporulation sigma factor SigK [Mollicutes bacterium]|nr:RNA polymerase sporulation sigma factor SigK [Mollicutes bacterium]
MMLGYLITLLKSLIFFTGSYSINVFPDPLPKEEEEKEIQKMLLGDKEARNKLIEHNLRLVAHIVKKYESKEYDTDDLISIGTIGLVKGIDSYKPSKNTRITTYVARCIENEILMHYRSNKKHINNISLNDSIGIDKDGNEINLIDLLKGDDQDLALILNQKNNIELLYEYLNILNKREKEIIIKRYGLFNNAEATQKEIAKNLGISRSYVSRIEKRAITKMLREFMKNKSTL